MMIREFLKLRKFDRKAVKREMRLLMNATSPIDDRRESVFPKLSIENQVK